MLYHVVLSLCGGGWPFLTFWALMGYFWGWSTVQKLLLGLLILTNNFCFMSFALSLLYHVVLSLCGSGGSQRLLSLNPTTAMVVLLLGLWLLLGCDNCSRTTNWG